ncbi:thiol-disulfide isomerase/thioredoxin [Allocatelliglobosispora scoriae]|uniref:Thiol-disulfide isomerase/thioredoxin n=1 Tax=Allocatelliglobosispora scoriae TaxID=643052 RepID=A0A841BK19_9ACTN|nr:redoxin domain-containing protein [Allocatelliglobosispora scoriae]MBB5867688.1 thiol-disulfide isomerase/thioredoxin [Allocatelliglobosispora scoriae]
MTHIVRKAVIALLAAGSIGLAACGTAPSPAAPVGQPPAADQQQVPATLDWISTTVDGKPFNAASLAGKPAVLWFWASYCPDCQADAAAISALQQQYAGKVTFVGVGGLGSGTAAMKTFVTTHRLTGFTQLADDTGTAWKLFGIPVQRSYVLLNADAQIIQSGPLTPAALRTKLNSLA